MVIGKIFITMVGYGYGNCNLLHDLPTSPTIEPANGIARISGPCHTDSDSIIFKFTYTIKLKNNYWTRLAFNLNLNKLNKLRPCMHTWLDYLHKMFSNIFKSLLYQWLRNWLPDDIISPLCTFLHSQFKRVHFPTNQSDSRVHWCTHSNTIYIAETSVRKFFNLVFEPF